MGHDGAVIELWRRGLDKRTSDLRECVAAVVAGRCTERREQSSSGGGERLTMTFGGPTREIVYRHFGLDRSDDDGPFGTTTYAPY